MRTFFDKFINPIHLYWFRESDPSEHYNNQQIYVFQFNFYLADISMVLQPFLQYSDPFFMIKHLYHLKATGESVVNHKLNVNENQLGETISNQKARCDMDHYRTWWDNEGIKSKTSWPQSYDKYLGIKINRYNTKTQWKNRYHQSTRRFSVSGPHPTIVPQPRASCRRHHVLVGHVHIGRVNQHDWRTCGALARRGRQVAGAHGGRSSSVRVLVLVGRRGSPGSAPSVAAATASKERRPQRLKGTINQ